MDSILTSIKKLLGISREYDHFDSDIILYINTALSVLTQLGVGPSTGFSIQGDSAVWSDLLHDDLSLEMVKSYVHLKVKLQFDPPQSSAAIESIKALINEFEWRLNVVVDSVPEGVTNNE